ncbi:flagellar FlbD family protein [Candidatus Binatus sp.]|uniref:flagellar FlbD family protein n=1 Tax=Candidatus Binatus sp. TaxID=2811406 RepID=UPI003C3C8FDC
MAKLIYVTDHNKGEPILLNADQIESVSVLEIKSGTRTAITMVNGTVFHVQESLETLFGLSR